jgi:uncharacterized NAD(P)/FAD-binding protein YdhS
MDTRQILTEVKAEISRLQKVVDLLEGSTPSPRTAAATAKRKGHKWTAAQKKAMSEHQKAIWAKRKKRH